MPFMNSNPLVSVILPIRNEERTISNTLDSILLQDYGLDNIEIIIADGLSNDDTISIIEDYRNQYKNIKIIKNHKKIVPTGFNLALNISIGDVIIRVDGHTSIASDYIKTCVKKLYEKKASNVGGLMTAISNNFLGKLIVIATSSVFGVGNSYFHYSKTGRWVDTVYLGAWKRDVFFEIGGFDEDLVRNQDDEFNFRLVQNGGRIWLDPLIKSQYKPRSTLRKLFSQYFQYGLYKVRVLQKRKGIASYRQLVPPIFSLFLIFSFFISMKTQIPILILSLTYLPVNIIFSFLSSKKIKSNYFVNKILSFFLFPLIFFTLHLSYGLGYLFGFLFFIKKWGDYKTYDSCFDLKNFKHT